MSGFSTKRPTFDPMFYLQLISPFILMAFGAYMFADENEAPRGLTYEEWRNDPGLWQGGGYEPDWSIMPPELRPKYVELKGDGEEVAKLVKRYQTVLWPEWRDDAVFARDFEEELERMRIEGETAICTSNPTHKLHFRGLLPEKKEKP